MKQGQVLFLNEKEIESLLTNEKTLEIVDDVLKAYARGNVVNPVKLHLPVYPHHEGYINSMPSYNRETEATGIKVVSVYHDNVKKYGILTTMGTIILHDPETGMPYAIMGGTHITNMRTGAAAGLKARYLARKGSKVLAIVGAGAQGFSSMIMTLTAMGPGTIEEIRVSDLSAERREQFIEKGKALYPEMNFISSASNNEAMKGADVVLLCAAAPVPLLTDCELEEGVTVICVSEILTPQNIARFDRFYADFAACLVERLNVSGRYNAAQRGETYEDLTEEMVSSEIGHVMIGEFPGRLNDTDKLLAADVGMGIEDVGVARYVYELAVEKGLGQVLDFQNL